MKIRLLLVKNSCIYLHNSSFHCDINAFLPKNAAVIILCYTSLRHNEYWEMIQTFPFGTLWKNPLFWNSKLCQLHVDYMFSILIVLTLYISY